VVNATSRPLYLLERPVTNCVGGWVISRGGLDGCEKSFPTVGSVDCRKLPKITVKLFDFSHENSFEVKVFK